MREVVGSVVGWPKDNVSSKTLGKSILYGDEALNHRLALDLVFPLADGNLSFPNLNGEAQRKSKAAAEALMLHLVELARARKDQLVYAVIGAPADATIHNKQAILEVGAHAGISAAMVVSEPFSVAYGIDTLDDAIIVDIGAGTIDLCRLHGTLPERDDQISINRAGNYIDQELAKRIKARYPEAQFSQNMAKKAKERFSRVIESEDRAIVSFPVNGRPTELDVTAEIREAVSLIVPEILDAIQKLVASFDPEFQHRIRERVLLSGGGSQIFGLRKALEDGMRRIGGGNVALVDEPVYAGATGSLKLAREMPAEYWEKLSR
ncbi:MAG: rod shape-determining protein [Planctomycetota bacterium]